MAFGGGGAGPKSSSELESSESEGGLSGRSERGAGGRLGPRTRGRAVEVSAVLVAVVASGGGRVGPSSLRRLSLLSGLEGGDGEGLSPSCLFRFVRCGGSAGPIEDMSGAVNVNTPETANSGMGVGWWSCGSFTVR